MVFIFTLLCTGLFVKSQIDETKWAEFDDDYAQEFDRGQIVEFADDNDFWHSYALIPGTPLIEKGLLIPVYFICLWYLFLGISIVSDIFMGAIEVIISYSKQVSYEDEHGVKRTAHISLWNPTVANLTLMALGYSAPEILIIIIETIRHLGEEPGEIGPPTIVGSAVYNILIVTAVSVISVPTGITKKIQHFPVFAVTALTSLLAYVWLYIILEVWSEGKIEIAEAVLTLVFYPIFILVAYIADRISQYMIKKDFKKRKEDLEKRSLPMQEFFHILGANKVEKASKVQAKDSYQRVNGLNYFFKDHFGTENVAAENLEKIKKDLTPTDPIQQRIEFRRNVGKLIRGRERTEVKKNEILFKQIKEAAQEQPKLLNPVVGFKCLHYSVSEGIGKINVKFINKTGKEMEVGVRTIQDTATEGADYEKVDTVVEFGDGQIEQFVEVRIVNDDTFEPNEDFYVELYDPETKQRLAGADTRTKITIIDDDKPGKFGFTSRFLRVRGKDKAAKLKVLRQAGTDGQISVKFRTCEVKDNPLKAVPGIDFIPVSGTIVFEQGESQKEILIPILERNALIERGDYFEVELYEPQGGSELGKKAKATVEIIGDTEAIRKAKDVEEIIRIMQKEQNLTWCQQFKQACLLSPQIDKNGIIDEVTGWEAAVHFFAIGWKVLFACIPPARYLKGWPAFIIAFAFIGATTALVIEFAGLLGCVMTLKQSLVAITMIAVGTSLPDTFASRQAAIHSDTADVAIGNIAASNSVNVFLGFGIAWLIGAIYHEDNGGDFIVYSQ